MAFWKVDYENGTYFFAVAILVLILLSLRTDVWFTKSRVDIHFQDTYFVPAQFPIVTLIILMLGTFFSLGGTIGTRLKNRLFLFSFLIFICSTMNPASPQTVRQYILLQG
jgi:hypothetical protein